MWWNNGEIATWLTDKYSGENGVPYSGPTPKSTVLTLGTRETGVITVSGEAPWIDQFQQVVDAFQGVPGLVANTNLFAFLPTGGAHNSEQWTRIGAHALRFMYGAYFPQLNILSASDYSVSSIVIPSPTVLPTQPHANYKSECSSGFNLPSFLWGAAGGLLSMVLCAMLVKFIRKGNLSQSPEKKLVDLANSNPMNNPIQLNDENEF